MEGQLSIQDIPPALFCHLSLTGVAEVDKMEKDVFGSTSFSSHFAPRPLMSFAHRGGGKTRIKRE